jgi:hypothetical protein
MPYIRIYKYKTVVISFSWCEEWLLSGKNIKCKELG